MDAFDRIRGAVTTVLLERLEPRVLGREGPSIKPQSYFHVSLWAHALLAGDTAHLARALSDPHATADEDVNRAGVDARGLMVLTIFRHDLMTMHARKERVLASLRLPLFPASPVVPGFPLAMPVLAAGLSDPDEHLPVLAMTASCYWTFNGTLVSERRLP